MSRDALGRGLLSGRVSYPVERYLDRLLGRLGLGMGGGKKALDAGCGDGLVSAWLASHGWQVEAEDRESHPAWLGLSQGASGRLRFRRRDAAARVRGAFDLVLTKDMLHHAADPVAALRALKARVRPGGKLLVLECNRLNPVFYAHLTLLRGHEHFTRAHLLRLLHGAGLEPIHMDLVEARVWPWGGSAWQDAFERLQDLAEALPWWRPFVCYHGVAWARPGGRA